MIAIGTMRAVVIFQTFLLLAQTPTPNTVATRK